MNPWPIFAGPLAIDNNPLLEDISSLVGIDTIYGGFYQSLQISSTAVENLDNFAGLKYLDGHLNIGYNPNLISLDGFAELNYVDGWVSINNVMLSDCFGICPLLSTGTVTSTINLWNNLTGCNSVAEITVNNCDSDCSNYFQQDYNFSLGFSNCTALIGPADIFGTPDNCIENSYLFIDGSTNTSSLEYGCNELGSHNVTLFFDDDTLTSTIHILDPNNFCEQDTLIVSGMINGDQHHKSSDYLGSDALVKEAANVDFEAGKTIELMSNFEVEINAIFHGYIDVEVCN